MGRRLFEIKSFDQGVVSNADGKDVDPQSAAFALNIDHDAPYGVLKPGKSPSSLTGAGVTNLSKPKPGVDRTGNRLIAGFNGNDITVRDLDAQAQSTFPSLTTIDLQRCSIETLNNEMFAGVGKNAPPLRIAKPFTGQSHFGSVLSGVMQSSTHGLSAPKRVPLRVTSESGSSVTVDTLGQGSLAGLLPVRGAITVRITTALFPDMPKSIVIHYTGISGSTLTGTAWPADKDLLVSDAGVPNAEFSQVFFARKADSGDNGYVIDGEFVTIFEPGGVNFELDVTFTNPVPSVPPAAPEEEDPDIITQNSGGDFNFESKLFFGNDDYEEVIFPAKSQWAFAVSFIYDRGKESPLTLINRGFSWSQGNVKYSPIEYWRQGIFSGNEWLLVKSQLSGTIGGEGTPEFSDFVRGFKEMVMNLQIIPTGIHQRVTGINVYMAQRDDHENDTMFLPSPYQKSVPFGYVVGAFRKIWEIEVEDEPSQDTVSVGGNIISYSMTRTLTSTAGTEYEDSSGISQNIRNSQMWYEHSVAVNRSLFVGNVKNNNAPDEDWTNYIVKSAPFQYESFNWASDFAVLPNPVRGISAFGSRIIAFDDNNSYIINPEGMFIEHQFPLAPINANSFIATDKGVFILSEHHLYLFDGRDAVPLSDRVQTSTHEATWGFRQAIATALAAGLTDRIWIQYDEAENCILVCVNEKIFVLNLRREAWFLYSFGSSYRIGGKNHSSRIIACPLSGGLEEFFTGSLATSLEWISQRLSMGQDSQEKKFRLVESIGDNMTVNFRLDGGSWISSLTTSNKTSNANNIQIRLTGGNTSESRSLKVLYRDKGGYPN